MNQWFADKLGFITCYSLLILFLLNKEKSSSIQDTYTRNTAFLVDNKMYIPLCCLVDPPHLNSLLCLRFLFSNACVVS